MLESFLFIFYSFIYSLPPLRMIFEYLFYYKGGRASTLDCDPVLALPLMTCVTVRGDDTGDGLDHW